MAVAHLHSFLVHPTGTKSSLRASTIDIGKGGKLVTMLDEVFVRAKDECNIDIAFTADAKQHNAARAELLEYARAPSLPHGQAIARRLEAVTTGRSGMGLLFVMAAGEKSAREVVLSRFPADTGILADEAGPTGLSVKFLERVFMKSAHSYKSARYVGDARAARDFWNGAVVDRQITHADAGVSEYWIKGFLLSDFRATSEFATKRFAHAIRQVLRSTTLPDVREQVSAASRLASGYDGRNTTVRDVMNKLGLDAASQAAVVAALPKPSLADQSFKFSAKVFREEVGFRLVSLNNGALLGATNEEFDRIFAQRADGDEKTYSTKGRVVEDRLRKESP